MRPGLRGGAGRVGGQGLAEGQAAEAGRQGRGTEGRTEAGWLGVGRQSDRATDRWKQLDSLSQGEQNAEKRQKERERERKRGRETEGEGARGREREGERERAALACILPSRRPPLSEGRGQGTEWELESDAGTEDRNRDLELLVGPRHAEGPTDRHTHGLPAGASGSSESRAQESENPALSCPAERQSGRQTCRGTDWQTGGGGSFTSRSQPGRGGGGGAP